jgi:hypothetical protein
MQDLVNFLDMLAVLSDEALIRAYEDADGEGPMADAIADEMERRGLDY